MLHSTFRHLKCLTLVSVLACSSAGAAQTPERSEGHTVSLDSCRSMAVSNNKQMRIQAAKIKQAGYQKEEAFAAYLPSIDFAGGYMYNQKNISIFDSDQHLPIMSFNGKDGYDFDLVAGPDGMPVMVDGKPVPKQVAYLPKDAMTYDIHNVFFGAVTLTQPIYMGGKIVAMNKITKYAKELAESMHDNTAEDVIYAVDAAYWQVVSLKAKHELAQSFVNLLDTLRSNVQAMVKEGVATKSDLLTVDVKLNEANVDLLKVENGLTLSRMALAEVCGLPVNTVMQLEDEDAGSRPACDQPIPAIAYDMNEVYSRRPDLQALELGVKITEQQGKVAMASMLPNVALIGGYAFSNPNMHNGYKNRFGGAFHVGAMLTIPIWHWGGNYNKYRAAKTETTIMRLQLEDAKEKIQLQVSQAAFKAHESIKTYNMTLSNLASANENLRHAQLAFREGMATTDHVMAAQTAWLKANSENIDAGIDVNLCKVYLSKVLGTMDYEHYYDTEK
ncbi:MAG: TolC family protein [Muribaculum sp.]|nr:TolC family protein [Muribaculum sp.]